MESHPFTAELAARLQHFQPDAIRGFQTVSQSEGVKVFVDELSSVRVPKTVLVNVHGSVHAVNLDYHRALLSVEVIPSNAFAAKYSDSPAGLLVGPN